mmetsp:Transcript_18091/g.18152  ORF Transcript_18091/g.18152 Transcript_18091/m.18152 type:complete len:163 (-) Transcript_18091:127-615(-)|eukprot:CAMPEP_0182417502 /NCGR_PEP_ID=MMETSP1167-20130531/1989_1 /TAXON_ID=2988 /ORGANISM="Mallomonas Sp, Strain CCMP3275" /LENGTH=162 /DNA_ID=CAMNT_0024591131 /DNA_START=32 /DNA_END=520 /DNA_ORIENTATION=+
MLRAISTSLLVLISLLALRGSSSQQQEQAQQQLNKETIDAILRSVSPGCRSEMESALASQSDISEDCRMEIQAVLQSFQRPQDGVPEDSPQESSSSSKSTPKLPPSVHPGIYVAVFMAIFFTMIAIYIMYVNKLKSSFPQKQPKKLSKRKVEKMRQQNKPLG